MAKDTYYYDLIGVVSGAKEVVIKKLFLQLAIAKENTQEVNEAYLILSDAQKRAVYDEVGRVKMKEQGVLPEGKPDPIRLFNEILGTDRYEDYVGKFRSAQAMAITILGNPDDEAKADPEPTDPNVEDAQVKVVAGVLNSKIASVLQGKKSLRALQADVAKDVGEFVLHPFSVGICHEIGKAYIFEGKAALKSQKSFTGRFHKMGSSAKRRKETLKGIMAISSQVQSARNTMFQGRNPFMRAGYKEAMTSQVFGASLASINFEVGHTFQQIADHVLNDNNVNPKEKAARANALIAIGEVFEQAQRKKGFKDFTVEIYEGMLKV